jgi:hypothetical protein
VFTGALGINTPAPAGLSGGLGGAAFDPCYHQACDDSSNISARALDEMSDAVAGAIATFGHSTAAVNGQEPETRPGKGKGRGKGLERAGHAFRR